MQAPRCERGVRSVCGCAGRRPTLSEAGRSLGARCPLGHAATSLHQRRRGPRHLRTPELVRHVTRAALAASSGSTYAALQLLAAPGSACAFFRPSWAGPGSSTTRRVLSSGIRRIAGARAGGRGDRAFECVRPARDAGWQGRRRSACASTWQALRVWHNTTPGSAAPPQSGQLIRWVFECAYDSNRANQCRVLATEPSATRDAVSVPSRPAARRAGGPELLARILRLSGLTIRPAAGLGSLSAGACCAPAFHVGERLVRAPKVKKSWPAAALKNLVQGAGSHQMMRLVATLIRTYLRLSGRREASHCCAKLPF